MNNSGGTVKDRIWLRTFAESLRDTEAMIVGHSGVEGDTVIQMSTELAAECATRLEDISYRIRDREFAAVK